MLVPIEVPPLPEGCDRVAFRVPCLGDWVLVDYQGDQHWVVLTYNLFEARLVAFQSSNIKESETDESRT